MDVREAVRKAGPELWMPAHHEGEPPMAVAVADVVALPGGAFLAVGRAGEDVLVAPVVVEAGECRRARAGEGAWRALAEVVASGGTGALRGELLDGFKPPADERAMGVDQTNESVVLGERFVLKLYVYGRPGADPGRQLPRHLAAVGFAEMPRPVGFLTWQDAMVASVAVYVPGARDGWEWYVEALSAACDGDAPWEEADEPAGAIGVLVARLHRALATPSTTTPTPVSTADPDLIRGWGRRAEATLDEALASTTGEEGQRLRAVEAAARREVATLASVDRTPIMRIHGDLHVGQILRTPDGELLVSDFDGNPLAPAEERGMPDAAARDVASMARAIDHVGRVVARRRTDRADAIEAWIVRSREAFLAAYRLGLGDRIDLFDERLLRPFEVAQEAHEYVYAARYLPRWRYVPDAAMPALLGLAT